MSGYFLLAVFGGKVAECSAATARSTTSDRDTCVRRVGSFSK